jgi:hypothetical protein
MSSEYSALNFALTLVLFGLGPVVVILYSYGALWAYRIRRALMSPLFKERALWVQVVAIFFVVIVSANLLIRYFAPTNFYLSFFQYTLVDAAGIVTLAWIDTTIKMARRSDPLNRNTISWKQLRYVVWAFTFITTTGSLFSVGYLRIDFFTPQGTGGAFVSGSFGWVLFGFIALILSYRRSRDPTLREHLKWFGLFVFLLFIVGTILSGDILVFRISAEVLLAVAAYFLYRGVKSLAPFSNAPLERNLSAPGSP